MNDVKSTKRKSGPRRGRSSTAEKHADGTGSQQNKENSVGSSVLGLTSVLSKPAPASVKKARIQALTFAKEADTTTIAVGNQSSDTALVLTSAPTKNRRSSITTTQMTTVIVDGMKRYKCDECGYTNNRRGRMSKHMLDHKEKPFICESCNRKFADQDLLDMHSKIHQNRCSNCKKKFPDKLRCERHEKVCKPNSNKIGYECYLCKYSHWTKFCLIEHMRKHTGEKPYHCGHCSTKFSKKYNLKVHLSNIHNKN